MLVEVLSNVDSKDYESCASVCSTLGERIFYAAKKQESEKFKNFIDALMSASFSLHHEELQYLQERKENFLFSRATTLFQLKTLLFHERVKIKILLGLDGRAKEFQKLVAKVEIPWMFNGVFDDVFPLEEMFQKKQYLLTYITKLVKEKLWDQTVDIFNLIPAGDDDIYSFLIDHLIHLEQYEKAFELLKKFPNDHIQLKNAVEAFAFMQRVEETLALLGRMTQQDDDLKKYLCDLVRKQADPSQFPQALRIINAIEGTKYKDDAYTILGTCAVNFGDTDLALQVIILITTEDRKNYLRNLVSLALVKNKKLEASLKVASTISNQMLMEQVYKDIAQVCIEHQDFKEAEKIAGDYLRHTAQNSIFLEIVIVLSSLGRLEEALEIISKFSEEQKYTHYYYDNALSALSQGFAGAGRLDEAFKVANMIIHKEYRKSIFDKLNQVSKKT